MSEPPLVLAVPSKGRLQENAAAFFARAGLPLAQARGARDYRASLAGLANVEVLFLSAAEIVSQLASGAVHLGVTGEDLVRDAIPDVDATVEILTGLGFGYANVVVAVPQAWIDVRTMSDLDEVADEVRARHGRRLRVATKYMNLTRRFFAERGVADYRIVESPGATEGSPAAGTADLIVDITTTGATLAANGLKVLDDGVMLRSEARLVAAMGASWTPACRHAAGRILDRIAGEEAARTTREIRTRIDGGAGSLVELARRHDATTPFGAPTGGELVLHCPVDRTFALVEALNASGAECVTVRTLDYVFRTTSPLSERLARRLDATHSE